MQKIRNKLIKTHNNLRHVLNMLKKIYTYFSRLRLIAIKSTLKINKIINTTHSLKHYIIFQYELISAFLYTKYAISRAKDCIVSTLI